MTIHIVILTVFGNDALSKLHSKLFHESSYDAGLPPNANATKVELGMSLIMIKDVVSHFICASSIVLIHFCDLFNTIFLFINCRT